MRRHEWGVEVRVLHALDVYGTFVTAHKIMPPLPLSAGIHDFPHIPRVVAAE